MSDLDQNQTTTTSDSSQYDEFTKNLVTAMLGVSIDFIKPEKRDEMVDKCKTIFKDFMFGYFKENFTEMDLIRLKASQSQANVFDKFPDMITKFEQAYQEFLNQLELSWKEEPQDEGVTADA
jgi:hypothetical protein